jgi:hypothetical protein
LPRLDAPIEKEAARGRRPGLPGRWRRGRGLRGSSSSRGVPRRLERSEKAVPVWHKQTNKMPSFRHVSIHCANHAIFTSFLCCLFVYFCLLPEIAANTRSCMHPAHFTSLFCCILFNIVASYRVYERGEGKTQRAGRGSGHSVTHGAPVVAPKFLIICFLNTPRRENT